jgi:hypothetical protein
VLDWRTDQEASMAVEAATIRPNLERAAVDRWIYVAMAALFLLTAVVGFGPNSAAILTHELPSPPLLVHVHAALMTTWLGLLFAQTTLVAMGRRDLHRALGVFSFVLAPCLLVGMFAVMIWRQRALADFGQFGPAANILLAQGRSIIYFALFFVWAMLARKRDLETHKRMLLLATVVLLPAGIGRMTWLPTTAPASYDALHGYMLLLLAPAVAYDVARLGRPHRAYVSGLLLLLPWMIATHFLWNTPWWRDTAAKLMGLDG